MKVFITSLVDVWGTAWEGPRVYAKTWEEAQAKSDTLGVILDGVLHAKGDGAN